MKIEEKIKLLYDKDNSTSYNNLLELEKLSEKENTLYSYFDTFLEMINSEKYVLKVRGYRLICKQAKWDKKNKIDYYIDNILEHVEDEKPTAVRQNIRALQDIIVFKSKLRDKIRKKLLKINVSQYKDTMRPLIEKDIKGAIELIDSY